MKKLLIVGMLIIMFSCTRNSTGAFIPDDVLLTFNDTYPEAEKVKWRVTDSSYLATFKEGSETKEAIYQLDGTFVRED